MDSPPIPPNPAPVPPRPPVGRSRPGALPPMPPDIHLAVPRKRIDRRRVFFLCLGLGLFLLFYGLPLFPPAAGPDGQHSALTPTGQAAIGLFLMAAVWWVFEVVPLGVTALTVGCMQALFGLRPAREAFRDFMDPSVMFIFGSILLGLAFGRSGVARRIAYRVLRIAGERTVWIMLGCFVTTAALSHLMAHTAVAAAMFPIIMAIHALYDHRGVPTRFGKGLFIGMAYVSGAGSICTYLGSARAAAGAALFHEFTGRHVSFGELSLFLLPVGWAMVLLLWGLMMVLYRPERAVIPGLRDKARRLSAQLGPIRPTEIVVVTCALGMVVVMLLQSTIPALRGVDRAAIMLAGALVLFVTGAITKEDLEDVPWNVVLLFGGAMSLGYCLYQTGAAEWLAVTWLMLFHDAPAVVFLMCIAVLVAVMTNVILNVAAIALILPVGLVMAPHFGLNEDVVFFVTLTMAGMPFLLLIGQAPNTIAYGSRQFTVGEFFITGIPATVLLLGVVYLAVQYLWPLLDLPVLAG